MHLSAAELPLNLVKLPPGFKIQVYASNVKDARSMALGAKGTVFVATRKEGKVYAVKDRKVKVLASNLIEPNGIAFHEGALYVAEVRRIIRFDDIENNLDKPKAPRVIYDQLPDQPGEKTWSHSWRYIAFGPDGLLYVAAGAPCNVCESSDKRFATILRMKKDGSDVEIYASGIRNSVGMDFDPQTKDLWFTNNGRDYMGEEVPPDTLNHAPQKGLNFGFPFCHAGIPDPEFGFKHKCSEFEKPALKLPAHVASLGMRFYTGHMFPNTYRNQIFIAEHGSWNRNEKIGYRISLVRIENGKVSGYETFADGFKQGERVWGRPVDLLVLPDGSMLISDDYAGVIYRLSYD